MLFNLDTIEQHFDVPKERKENYGEVVTEFSLIHKMFSQLPEHLFSDPNLTWLDVGAGYGYFSMVLFNKLFNGLENIITDPKERKNHILTKNIHMIEVNPYFKNYLIKYFSLHANIQIEDFINYSPNKKFDVIIGNVPYNILGNIKTPTNKEKNKKKDGKTVWPFFIKKMVHLLKDGGYLNVIIPSLWMKVDKANMHTFLCNYNLLKCFCLTNTETNKCFKGNAQTPTCFFTLKKEPSQFSISLYDSIYKAYIDTSYNLAKPIPLCGVSIVNKLKPYIKKYGYIETIKTNLPPKNVSLETTKTTGHPYINVHTCKLNGLQPTLEFKYSNKKLKYCGEPKLILAHKMYGFPYYDISGVYGISSRDNYIIKNKSHSDLLIFQSFLNTKLALYIFETTRYRMKYLEKEAFTFLPDISKIEDFPKEITNSSVFDYFDISIQERNYILDFHKNYLSFKN